MSSPADRTYDLASAALEEQRRVVDSYIARLPPVLAAGAVAATLLTKPAFAGSHPDGRLEIACLVVGLLGVLALLGAAVAILRPLPVRFSFDTLRTWKTLKPIADRSSEDVYALALARLMRDQEGRNQKYVDQLQIASVVALLGLVAEVIGLGLAAGLAS